MSILDKLASALSRNDERPNVALAEALVARPDKRAIATLAQALSTAPGPIQNDAIKVLYEIGEQQPDLVAPHADAFIALLESTNNRNVWGALSALASIASVVPQTVFAALPAILAAADKSSVIAKDKTMSILGQLSVAGYSGRTLPIMLARLETTAPNQFPAYAEFTAAAINAKHKPALISLLETRLANIDAPAKRARLEKLLRRLHK